MCVLGGGGGPNAGPVVLGHCKCLQWCACMRAWGVGARLYGTMLLDGTSGLLPAPNCEKALVETLRAESGYGGSTQQGRLYVCFVLCAEIQIPHGGVVPPLFTPAAACQVPTWLPQVLSGALLMRPGQLSTCLVMCAAGQQPLCGGSGSSTPHLCHCL
jgi:hypothetical protein